MKMLVCGINASNSQWCGWIFILCYTHRKLALLLHKQGLVATGVGTTVFHTLSLSVLPSVGAYSHDQCDARQWQVEL